MSLAAHEAQIEKWIPLASPHPRPFSQREKTERILVPLSQRERE
jgi:hypothetical protein